MRFNPATAVAALGSLWLGQSQGRQIRSDQAQEDQQRALQMYPQLAQMEQSQRESELEPYRFAASLQGQTPESQQAAIQALLSKTQAQGAQPRQYGLGGYQAQYHATYPHAAVPMGTQTQISQGPSVPVPTPQFEPPGEDVARQSLLRDAQGILNDAQTNGDAETANSARDITIKLARKQLTVEQASSALGALQSQGKVSSAQDKLQEEPFARLQKMHDEQRVKAPFIPAVQGLLAKYAQAPPTGAARRTYLQGLHQARADLEGQDYIDLSPDDKQRLENAKAIGAARVTEQDRKFTSDLTRVKGSPKDVLAVVDSYHRWAQTPDAKQYGARVPAELDPTPQTITEQGPDGKPVTRVETPEEVDARRLGGASKYLDDPKDRAALQKTRISLLGRLLTSGRIGQGSLEPILSQLDDALNGGAEPVKLSGLKFDQMTAAQREQISQFNQRQAQGDRNFGLQQGRLQLEQNRAQLETDKFSYEKDHGKYARMGAKGDDLSKKDAKLLQEAQKARTISQQIIRGIDGKLFPEPDDTKRKADAQSQMQSAQSTINRLVGPLDSGRTKQGATQAAPIPAPNASTPQQKRAIFIGTLMRGAPGKPGLDRKTAEKYANQQRW